MVPRLKEAYCLLDAWTELNIHPAKIMQVSYNFIHHFINNFVFFKQEQVPGELHWYTHQDPLPDDVSTAKETLLAL